MKKKMTMHVITGTHWDREWRHTAEQSKLRLTDLVDSIIDILEKDPEYNSFILDGGTIVLEDYFTVRPEMKEKVKSLIERKKLFVVSWYTLPETYTVAPEALIRNLQLGTEMAKEYGGAMRSGYTATGYGQTSQLPQIYENFGIKTAMFYRGTNKYELPPLFKWEAADGTQIYVHKTFDEVTRTNWYFYVYDLIALGKGTKDLSFTYDRKNVPVHLCDDVLYEKAVKQLVDEPDFDRSEDGLKKALKNITEQSMPYAIGNHLLALNMEDNAQPHPMHAQMVNAMNEVSEDIEIIQDDMDSYMDTIIAENKDKELHVHKGELRYEGVDLGSWNGLYGVTHASRVKLKLINETAETNLINLAEPLAVFAAAYGAEYPYQNLKRAWRGLLANHAHDSIVGCAVDRAHDDALYGFSVAKTVAEEVTGRSLVSLFSKIDTKTDFNENTDFTVILFNTLAQRRKGVVEVVIDLPKNISLAGESDSVGVGSGADAGLLFYDIVDKDGNKVNYVELSAENIKMSVERKYDTATAFSAVRRRILIEADIPMLGYTTYALRLREPNFIYKTRYLPNREFIGSDAGILENEYLKIKINPNGTFDMLCKKTGKMYENMHYFTDEGQVGSAHKYVTPTRNPMLTSHGANASITLKENSALRAVFKIEFKMHIPSGAALDGRDRLRETVEMPVMYELTLEKGKKYLKIHTKITNKARDHKLYVNFPSGIHSDYDYAESAFAVESRSIRHKNTGDNAEPFAPCHPMQNFCGLSDGKNGLAFFSGGLREYEIRDDKERTMAITLLRTHRAYMTANPDMTPEEFDRYTGAHSFGELEYNYAVYPHSGDWKDGSVQQEAYDFKVGVKAIQGIPVSGEIPCENSFITVDNENIVLAAVKRAEDGNGYIVRFWNKSDDNIRTAVKINLPVNCASLAKMNEEKIEDIDFNDNKAEIDISAHKIVTLRIM